MMIDCHAHLAATAFDADRGEVLARAKRVGVERVIVVGEDGEDDLRVLELSRLHGEMLSPCLGLHPDRFADDRQTPTAESIAAVTTLARENRKRIVAIGEVGLDYWYAKSESRRAAQRACLEKMVMLAEELGLTLNVHSRSAGHQTLDLLAACSATRVLMHAFDGRASHATRAAEQQGFLFSIPPSVVRSAQKQKLVRRLPLDALTLESDSPVLGPEPGVRNEPANLTYAVRCIAKLHRTSEERVREVTTTNARRLFAEPDSNHSGR